MHAIENCILLGCHNRKVEFSLRCSFRCLNRIHINDLVRHIEPVKL